MKGTVIALVCAAALAHAELNENGCPINPFVDILKPHPNCNKYYQCTQGELLERKCASDLVFDEETQTCDWPDNVDCNNRIPPTPDSSEEENQSNVEDGENSYFNKALMRFSTHRCAAKGSDGVLVAHENCNQFYVCDAGVPVARVCWGNLLFNPINNQCDWPEKVNCGDRIVGGGNDGGDSGIADGGNGDGDSDNGGNGDPSEAPIICAVDGSDGVLVAHENCSQFYKCNAGIPVTLDCWGNLLFNPTNNHCDWPENVDCGNRINKGKIGGRDGGNGDGGNGDGGNGDGGNGDSGNGDGGNGDGGNGDGGNGDSGNGHGGNGDGGNGHGGNGNGGNGDGGNGHGGNGQGGNGDGGNGDGGNGKSHYGGNSVSSEAPKICAAEGSDGILVAHENCNQFYKCNGGKPVARDCWGNLLFNPVHNQCDWPDKVNCGDRIISGENGGSDGDNGVGGNADSGNGGNSKPSKAPEICAAKGSDGVLVAHENCNQFYMCNGGYPVALDCWGNHLFNPANNQCDWPDIVNCEDRIIVGGNGSGDGGNGDGNGDGGNGNNGNGGNSDPSEAAAICSAEGSDGMFVAHENCNQFYSCVSGKPVAHSCWGILLFNPANNQCDYPDNVNCEDRIIRGENSRKGGGNGTGGNEDGDNKKSINEGNSNPSQAPEICAIDGSDGTLVPHEHCNQFYVCEAGAPLARVCWDNLLFNPTNNQCDRSDVVNCGDRVIFGEIGGNGDDGNGEDGNGDDGNGEYGYETGDNGASDNRNSGDEDSGNGGEHENPSKVEEICAVENFEDVLVAHEDCNKFYQCKGGKPVVRICYGDLYFNPSIDACDWRQNVNCGSRNKPVQSFNKHSRLAIRYSLRKLINAFFRDTDFNLFFKTQ